MASNPFRAALLYRYPPTPPETPAAEARRRQGVSEGDVNPFTQALEARAARAPSPQQRARRDETTPAPPPSQTLAGNILEIAKGIPGGAIRFGGTAATGTGALLHGTMRDTLAVLDRIDRGEQVPETEDVIGYQHMPPELRTQTRAEIEAAATRPLTEQPLVRAGEAISDFGAGVLPATPGYEESIGRQLGEGLGSVVAGAAASGLGGPLAATTLFAFAGSGEAVERALMEGASEDDVIRAGRAGVIPGLTDTLPIEMLLGRVPVPGAGLIKVPANQVGRAMRAIGRIGMQAFVEGVQEGGQEFLQNLIAREVYAPEQELGEDILPSMGIGAGVGGLAEAGRQAIVNFAGRRRRGRADRPGEAPAAEPTMEGPPEPSAPEDIVSEFERAMGERAVAERAADVTMPPPGQEIIPPGAEPAVPAAAHNPFRAALTQREREEERSEPAPAAAETAEIAPRPNPFRAELAAAERRALAAPEARERPAPRPPVETPPVIELPGPREEAVPAAPAVADAPAPAEARPHPVETMRDRSVGIEVDGETVIPYGDQFAVATWNERARRWVPASTRGNTPQQAVLEERSRRERERQAEQRRGEERRVWDEAVEAAKAGAFAEQHARAISRFGDGLIATADAKALLRGMGLRAGDADQIVQGTIERRETSGGARLFDAQEIVQRGQRRLGVQHAPAATAAREQPTTERTELGEQHVIPGAERIGQREQAERAMQQPRLAGAPQQGVTGLELFDPSARATAQEGLFEGRQEAERTAPAEPAPEAPARPARPPKKPKVVSLTEFIRRKGGLKQTDRGELKARDLTNKTRPGLISAKGMQLDDAALAAAEEGYFPGGRRPTHDDFINALERDVFGDPVLRERDQQAWDDFQAEQRAYEESEGNIPPFAEFHAGVPFGKLWDWFLGPWFAKHYETMGRLPGGKRAYMQPRRVAQGRIDEMDRIAGDLYRRLNRYDAATKDAIFTFLTTAGADPRTVPAPARRDAEATKRLIDIAGRELVHRGALDQAQYDKYRDRYLPRIYLKFLFESQGVSLGSSGRPIVSPEMMGRLKKRKDIPQWEREILLGEIKDPAYLASRAFGEAARSIAIWDFLESVAARPEWVYPKALVDWRGKKVTARWLESEAQRLRAMRHLYPEAMQPAVRDMADEMDTAAREALADPPDPKLYKQVPDSKRYGHMRGLWVRKEIFDDLVNTAVPRYHDETLQQVAQQARRFNSLWKGFMTAWSLPAQVRNFMSGYIASHLYGEVPFHRMPDRLLATIHDMATDGRHWQAARRHGVRSTSFAQAELLQIHNQFRLKQSLAHYKNNPYRFVKELAGKVNDTVGNVYSLNEQVWKTLIMMHHMKRGKSEADAADIAHEAIFDYSDVPNWVRHMRSVPLPYASPFLTFTYKALPKTMEAALKRPWSFLPYLAMVFGTWGLLKGYNDLDDEDADKLWALLPQWLDHGLVMWLPGKDQHGRWQPIDLSYIVPFGGWWDVAMAAAEGDIGDVAFNLGVGSHPMFSIPAAIKGNRDVFGRPVYTEGAPPQQRLMEVSSYILNQLLPLRTFTTAAEVLGAMQGQVRSRGQPGRTPAQAAARLGGVNIFPLDTREARSQRVFQMDQEIRAAERVLDRIMRDRSLSREARTRAADRQKAYIRELVARQREFMRETSRPPR